MKIAWLSHPTELEHDIRRSLRDHPDLEMKFGLMGPPNEWGPDATGDWRMKTFEREELFRVLAEAKAWTPDLIILRYPYWIQSIGVWKECTRMMHDAPVMLWQSEQGPTKSWGVECSVGWHHIALNTPEEESYYREHLDMQTPVRFYYLPFGCAAWTDAELTPDPTRGATLVADGTAHYACADYGTWKRQSVEMLVIPFLEKDLALWGSDHYRCGWPGIRNLNGKYRGRFDPRDYIHIYPACKVYLGVSWNWYHGGYGTKLARAMSTGIPVMWHRTPVRLGVPTPIQGKHLLWVASSTEATHVVQALLEDDAARQALGQRGRRWAVEQWEWGKNLKRLVHEYHESAKR